MFHVKHCLLLAVILLSGCAGTDALRSLQAEKDELAAILAGVKDDAAKAKAAHLAAVEADKGHAARVVTLEQQQLEQRQIVADAKAELARINIQLQAERDAVIQERLYWWSGVCAVVAGLVCMAGFFLPGVNVWLWRGSAGLGILAAILVALAPLTGWIRWVGTGIIGAGLTWAVWEAVRHSVAMRGTILAGEIVKVAGATAEQAKDVYRAALGKARIVVDRMRHERPKGPTPPA